MAKNKTIETAASVADYLAAITDDKRRNDCLAIVTLITESTGLEPKMWGPAIVGFGSYYYVYESGREGDASLTGLASRVNAITLYFGSQFDDREVLLSKLGKYKEGKSCLYVQRIEDIDMGILGEIVKNSTEYSKQNHQC